MGDGSVVRPGQLWLDPCNEIRDASPRVLMVIESECGGPSNGMDYWWCIISPGWPWSDDADCDVLLYLDEHFCDEWYGLELLSDAVTQA